MHYKYYKLYSVYIQSGGKKHPHPAKGGVVVALAEEFGLPVHAVGVGEGADDLQPFDAQEFANALTGVTDRQD